jgi:molecular chaperone GrpE
MNVNKPEDYDMPETPETDAGASDADELARALRERDEFYDQLRRTQAEFVNYQKRSKAQADQDRQFAASGLALDLLGVIDNFERALEAARVAGGAAGGIVEGLDMVQKQLLTALGKHGVRPIEALHRPFDPTRHEALLHQPAPEFPEGTVVAELGKGYTLHDRVLRPSKVAVAKAP